MLNTRVFYYNCLPTTAVLIGGLTSASFTPRCLLYPPASLLVLLVLLLMCCCWCGAAAVVFFERSGASSCRSCYCCCCYCCYCCCCGREVSERCVSGGIAEYNDTHLHNARSQYIAATVGFFKLRKDPLQQHTEFGKAFATSLREG